MKISILLKIFVFVTTLKTFLLSNLTIFFYLNIEYSANGILVFLINISNLSIRKQISDRFAILAHFKYFLGHPWFCLIRARKAKVVKNNLAIYSIRSIFAKGVSV